MSRSMSAAAQRVGTIERPGDERSCCGSQTVADPRYSFRGRRQQPERGSVSRSTWVGQRGGTAADASCLRNCCGSQTRGPSLERGCEPQHVWVQTNSGEHSRATWPCEKAAGHRRHRPALRELADCRFASHPSCTPRLRSPFASATVRVLDSVRHRSTDT